MNHTANTTRAGFTLIEMLVVISIITIVLTLSFPMIGAMRRDSSSSSGINTITVAIPSARRYATSDITFPNDLDPGTVGDQAGVYSGAGALFTPAGEIRLISQKFAAGATSSGFISGSPLLEQHGPRVVDEQTGSGLPLRELNGFNDLKIDYLQLPSDTGVAGINRVSGGPIVFKDAGAPLLLPPPFAVWFNQNGYLVATGWDNINGHTNDYQFVYYDGNYDGDYNTLGVGARRGSIDNSEPGDPPGYYPDRNNPDAGAYDPNTYNNGAERYELPFEMIEAVIGVYVYSREAFQGAVDNGVIEPWSDFSVAANDARWEWMRENGEMLMFSKQTGAMMRNRDQ